MIGSVLLTLIWSDKYLRAMDNTVHNSPDPNEPELWSNCVTHDEHKLIKLSAKLERIFISVNIQKKNFVKIIFKKVEENRDDLQNSTGDNE